MDMYDSLFYPDTVLNEQIAKQIFDNQPEHGPVLTIMDKQGNCWHSDPQKFSEFNISESFLKDICDKIDDGAEPVVTQANDCSVIASQIVTERTNCGYVIVVLPQYSPESTLINIDLIEILLNQINLIANLIEKNNLLHELQMKNYGMYGRSEIPSN